MKTKKCLWNTLHAPLPWQIWPCYDQAETPGEWENKNIPPPHPSLSSKLLHIRIISNACPICRSGWQNNPSFNLIFNEPAHYLD